MQSLKTDLPTLQVSRYYILALLRAVQSQKAVSAYFTNGQILPFGFAQQYSVSVDTQFVGRAGGPSLTSHTLQSVRQINVSANWSPETPLALRYLKARVHCQSVIYLAPHKPFQRGDLSRRHNMTSLKTSNSHIKDDPHTERNTICLMVVDT